MKRPERLTPEDVRSEFESFARDVLLRDGFSMNLCQYDSGEYIVSKTEIGWRCFLRGKGLLNEAINGS